MGGMIIVKHIMLLIILHYLQLFHLLFC